MPKHTRIKLVRSCADALSAALELSQLEELTDDEQKTLEKTRKHLFVSLNRSKELVVKLERRDEISPIPPALAPRDSFSWSEHERKAKLSRQKAELKELEGQLSLLDQLE